MQPHCPPRPRASDRSTTRTLLLIGLTAPLLAACGVTSRMEPYKKTDAVIQKGDEVVVLARKQHSDHEAEQDFVRCISDSLRDSGKGIKVRNSKKFEDKMYPWFEPSLAPLNTDDLAKLLDKPDVMKQLRKTGVRFLVWLDGSTDRVASGGGITCAAGIGGAGCLGLAWWEDDARYDATVWDVKHLTSAGTIHADVKGRSVMPAIVIPLPFITRPKHRACRGLTHQLEEFLTTPRGYGPGPNQNLG